MATEEPSKNGLYFVFKRLYLKNELCDPRFILLKSDNQVKTKLFGKFKKSGATLIFLNCEGGYESAPDNFL